MSKETYHPKRQEIEGDHNPLDPFTMTQEDFEKLSPEDRMKYLDFIGLTTIFPNRGESTEGLIDST